MSVVVGTDVVTVAEVAASMTRFGERYLQRVYTPHELAVCGGNPQRLAARYAAKEAVVKAFQVPTAEAATFAAAPQEVEVRGGGAAPEVALHGVLAHRASREGWSKITLSLSHEQCHAVAVVVVQRSAVRRRVPVLRKRFHRT